MKRSRYALDRRTMLKGLLGGMAAAVALPPLEAMFGANGDAYADGSPLRKRFGTFWWGNGTRPDKWTPDGTGTVWTPKEETAPLAALNAEGVGRVSIISGFNQKKSGSAHHAGRAIMLTGSYDDNAGTYGGPVGPSLDQVVADRWWQNEADRPLNKYISVGISRRGFGSGGISDGCSVNQSGDGISAEFSPIKLFESLFGTIALDNQTDIARKELRRSVLDVVAEDSKALAKRLGTADGQRLAAHLESIHEMESALGANGVVCTKPALPPEFGNDLSKEPLKEINEATAKIMAMALACDLTRVFSYAFTGMQTNTMFWWDPINATEGLHVMTHDDRNIPEDQKKDPQLARVNMAVTFMMEQFAFFLKQLNAVPEGDGTLLDNTLIYGTTEHADATAHSRNDMPIVLAGRAAGGIKSGLHYRGNGNNTTEVMLTCLHALGLKEQSFGSGETAASTPVSELLV